MRHHARTLFLLLGFLTVQPACSGSPLYYSAEAIEARVIDAVTKKPLEGVVVTANWQLIEGTIGGSRPIGQLKVMEAVTDKNGRFTFPAWGPVEVSKGHLVSEDPQLLLFKSGYHYQRLSNKYTSDRELRLRPIRRSDWTGKTIELQSFKGSKEKYAKHLGSLNNDLYPLLGSEACDWKQIPQMLLALTQQSRAFRKLGIEALYDVDVYLPVSERKCGSPKAFFEAYQP